MKSEETYRLFPSPIAREDIAVLSLSLAEFLVRGVVNLTLEVRASKKVLDNFSGVPVPYVVLGCFPLWEARFFREGAIVLEGHTLPWNMAKPDGVDLAVKIVMVSDGGRGGVRDERCSP
jgi:hypothetical protein